MLKFVFGKAVTTSPYTVYGHVEELLQKQFDPSAAVNGDNRIISQSTFVVAYIDIPGKEDDAIARPVREFLTQNVDPEIITKVTFVAPGTLELATVI